MKDKPICNFNLKGSAISAGKCIVTGSPIDCAVAAGKVMADPCLHQHIQYQIQHPAIITPYIQHMPKTNAVDAVRYSAQMGGEDHDITGYEIM